MSERSDLGIISITGGKLDRRPRSTEPQLTGTCFDQAR